MTMNNRQTWDTRSPLAAETVRAMRKQDPHDEVMAELRHAIEAVFELGYDDPADVVDYVRREAERWHRAFTDRCHCNRPPRYCVCP